MKSMIILYIVLVSQIVFSSPVDIDKSVKRLEKITGCKLIITSGFRTKKKNRQVGGAKHSYHLTDRARDLVPKSLKCISIKKLGEVACKLNLGVLVYKKSNIHVHIDNRKTPICLKVGDKDD